MEPPHDIELRSVLQCLPEAVFLFDKTGRIIELNGPAESLTGVARTELLGQDVRQVISRRWSNADSQQNDVVARALAGKHVRRERHAFSTVAGDPMEVVVSASPMCDLEGNTIGALMAIQDVTELSALQRQADDSERHLAVGQMTAGLAHDFNNVLSTISQALFVLQDRENQTERDKTTLGVIANAVHRGAEVVGNIREYLRGNREGRARLDVCQLLGDVLQLAQPVLEMRSGVNVVRHFQSVPAVEANATELRRVFTNLVLNALDAMPRGGTLTLACYSENGRVIGMVADNGAGIPVERQGKIFSPYFTTKARGMGMGLAGARRAVEGQGGQIRFNSAPGSGTTFYVLLPVANGSHHEPAAERVA